MFGRPPERLNYDEADGVENGSQPSAVAGSVRVLLVSSVIDNADVLAAAAKDSVLVVSYDAEHTTLEGLLLLLEEALAGRKAESIGIAAHDYGEAKFYLTGSGSFPRQW